MDQIDFTVAIVTYNGAERVPLVLERLRSQINPQQINWEILVVDNNSTDNTACVLQKNPLIRYSFEPQQGAAHARQRAIREAQAPLVGFLDDDNLPEDDWVTEAYQFALLSPRAGAYGSQIHGDYEIDPPPNFERIKAFLAITERGQEPLLYNPKLRFLPPSAGLVVRREAWLKNVPEFCILSGRVEGSMLTSEDLEALSYIQQAGWEVWYNPKMEILHKIPAHRLTKEYLIPFMGGIGLSRYVTRMVGVKSYFKPFLVLAYWFNDLRKICLHVLKYSQVIKTDIVAASERELLLKSWISPFYFWFKSPLKDQDKC
jgi:glycosyltransferase involved in cell wall biosynthesis